MRGRGVLLVCTGSRCNNGRVVERDGSPKWAGAKSPCRRSLKPRSSASRPGRSPPLPTRRRSGTTPRMTASPRRYVGDALSRFDMLFVWTDLDNMTWTGEAEKGNTDRSCCCWRCERALGYGIGMRQHIEYRPQLAYDCADNYTTTTKHSDCCVSLLQRTRTNTSRLRSARPSAPGPPGSRSSPVPS